MNGSQSATTKAVRQTRKEVSALRREQERTNDLIEELIEVMDS